MPARPQDGARFANSASWSAIQWKVAVDRMASTGGDTGNGSCRSATRYSTRSSPSRARACSTIETEPSSATTEP